MSKGRVIKDAASTLFGMPSLEKSRRQRLDPAYLERESEKIEQQAYEKGFASGEKAGLEMGEQKAKLLLNRLEQVIAEAERLRDATLKELEPQLVELSLAIAGKIMTEELRLRPEVVAVIVKEALKKVERAEPVLIRINPAMQALFMKHKPALLDVHPNIAFEADAAVPVSGAIIIGATEEIDTDIGGQLKNIAEDMGGGIGSD